MFQPAYRVGNSSAPTVGFNITALKRLLNIEDGVPWPYDRVRVVIARENTGAFDVRLADDHEQRGDTPALIVTPNRKTGQITSKVLHDWSVQHGYQPGRSYVLTPRPDDPAVYHVSPDCHIPTQYVETMERPQPPAKPLYTYWVTSEHADTGVAVEAVSARKAAAQLADRTDLIYMGQAHEARGGWLFSEGNRHGRKWRVMIDPSSIGSLSVQE